MAQTLRIIIKIQAVGLKIVEEANRGLNALNETIQKTSGAPLNEVSQKFDKIADRVKNLNDILLKTIKNVGRQTKDVADSTLGRLNKNIGQTTEVFLTRSTFALGTIAVLSRESAKKLASGAEKVSAGLGKSITTLKDTLNTALATASLQTTAFAGITTTFFSRLQIGSGIVKNLASFAFGTYLPTKIFLTEVNVLVRRLTGRGTEALTPLERATRLLTTLDISLHSTTISAGQLAKTAAFGVLTVAGPFSGLIAGIPFVNELLTTFLRLGERTRLRILSSLGSARAQITLVLLETKRLALTVLPTLLQFAQGFVHAQKEAGRAAEQVKKIGENSKELAPLQALAKTRLPFTVQFQMFVLEVRTFVAELLTKITEISFLLQNAGQKGQLSISNIRAIAQTTTNTILKKAHASVEAFEKTVRQIGVAERAGQLFAKILFAPLLPLKLIHSMFSTIISLAKNFARGFKTIWADADTVLQPIFTAAGKIGAAVSNVFFKSAQGIRTLWGNIAKNVSAPVRPEAKIVVAPILRMADFRTAGAQIPLQVAAGVMSTTSVVAKAMDRTTTIIAGYLPHSPAIFGPLRFLIHMGQEIVRQLAAGIETGLSFLVSSTEKFASLISDSIERAAKFGELSGRTGIAVKKLSALENALLEVGMQAEDVSFVFARINEVLRQAFNPEEAAKIREIGINLDAVRAAGDPALALLLEVGNVVRKFGPASTQAKQALDLIGTAVNTNLVNFLGLGSEEIQEFMREGVRLGIVYDETFVKMSAGLRALFARFRQVKRFLIDEVLVVVFPKLQELGDEILNFLENNRSNISAFIKIISGGILLLFELIRKMIILIIEDPTKAWALLKKLGTTIWNFIINSSSELGKILSGEVFDFFMQTGKFVLSVSVALVTNLFGEISSIAKGLFKRLGLTIKREYLLIMSDIDMFGITHKMLVQTEEQLVKLKVDMAAAGVDAKKIVENVVAAVKKDIETVGAASQKAVAKISDPTTYDPVKQVLEELLQNLKIVFANTTLQEDAAKLTSILEVPFAHLAAAVQKHKNQTKKALKEINQIQKEAAQNQFLTNQELLTQFLKKQEIESGGELKMLDLRSKVSERLSDRHAFELEETLQRQTKDLDAFIELVAAKENITKEAAARTREIQEFQQLQALELEKTLARQRLAEWTTVFEVSNQLAASTETIFSDLYEMLGKKNREFFLVSKGAAIAQAIINIAEGITKAIAQGGILGIAQGALVGVAGAIQIAKIAATTFAMGGTVEGGSGTRDDVPALLTAGEFVQPRAAVKFYGKTFMEAIRQRFIPQNAFSNMMSHLPDLTTPTPRNFTFQSGGIVPSVPSSGTQNPKNEITIVNILDKTEMGRFMQSKTGKNVLLNLMQDNSSEFRTVLST